MIHDFVPLRLCVCNQSESAIDSLAKYLSDLSTSIHHQCHYPTWATIILCLDYGNRLLLVLPKSSPHTAPRMDVSEIQIWLLFLHLNRVAAAFRKEIDAVQ